MTIVQLEYIVALDTYRNFGLAAEHCYVTQPTLSMQVQKLEETLGVKIFDRTRQPVIPTEIGVEIIEQARIVLKESERIKELITNRQGTLQGELKIGVIPTIAPYLMPSVISEFLERFPEVQLKVWEMMTEEITADLKNGRLDCGILSTPLKDSNLREIPLFYESFVAYLSASSKLISNKMIDPEDLDSEELWLLNEGHCMRNQILNICNRSERSNHSFQYNTDNVETLKRMVDMNNGMTLIPELSTNGLNGTQKERIRHFNAPSPSREISIVTHRNYLKRKLISALENTIVSAIPEKMRSREKKSIMDIVPD